MPVTSASSENPFDQVAPLITAAAADGDDFAGILCENAIQRSIPSKRREMLHLNPESQK